MKKVRFESPNKLYIFKMNDSECHSPRPFLEQEFRVNQPSIVPNYPRVLPYKSDPLQRYECSNSSPYPHIKRTQVNCLPEEEPCWKPFDDLNLSILDASIHEPRQPAFCKSILKDSAQNKHIIDRCSNSSDRQQLVPLSSDNSSNKANEPPNILVKDNSFFLSKDNLTKYHFNVNPEQTQFNRLTLGKENTPFARKTKMAKNAAIVSQNNPICSNSTILTNHMKSEDCNCHACLGNVECLCSHQSSVIKERQAQYHQMKNHLDPNCTTSRNQLCFQCITNITPQPPHTCKKCSCKSSEYSNLVPQNPVDHKTWAIERYEQSKQLNSAEIEKQKNVFKEKREPTVADLFKIIKLQNEQLQLLQEKVDKFMTLQNNVQPTITCSTEHVAVNTVEKDQGKMSVGVMTSFELIRTSTVINKEVLTQGTENAQIQCNKSQISIKEVVTKPASMNFLDGIIPKNVEQTMEANILNGKNIENVCEEKTLNEQSLYNLQVDNATTPLLSPEQSLYLDIRDYSESEASSNDQSNVGWTYYNKVMTHVNGMLQDSEMPSSASAMYRNMRQQCVQMQIDTTNLSVTKRVKFGDDPLGVHQAHNHSALATDTSLKMNQLAAKYLKGSPIMAPRAVPAPISNAAPTDMSFATKNYMEKHRLLQGLPAPSKPLQAEIPRFLDITALKQQPKFL